MCVIHLDLLVSWLVGVSQSVSHRDTHDSMRHLCDAGWMAATRWIECVTPERESHHYITHNHHHLENKRSRHVCAMCPHAHMGPNGSCGISTNCSSSFGPSYQKKLIVNGGSRGIPRDTQRATQHSLHQKNNCNNLIR